MPVDLAGLADDIALLFFLGAVIVVAISIPVGMFRRRLDKEAKRRAALPPNTPPSS